MVHIRCPHLERHDGDLKGEPRGHHHGAGEERVRPERQVSSRSPQRNRAPDVDQVCAAGRSEGQRHLEQKYPGADPAKKQELDACLQGRAVAQEGRERKRRQLQCQVQRHQLPRGRQQAHPARRDKQQTVELPLELAQLPPVVLRGHDHQAQGSKHQELEEQRVAVHDQRAVNARNRLAGLLSRLGRQHVHPARQLAPKQDRKEEGKQQARQRHGPNDPLPARDKVHQQRHARHNGQAQLRREQPQARRVHGRLHHPCQKHQALRVPMQLRPDRWKLRGLHPSGLAHIAAGF